MLDGFCGLLAGWFGSPEDVSAWLRDREGKSDTNQGMPS